MTGVRRFALASVCSVALVPLATRAADFQAPVEGPPSAIEQALIDHVCGAAKVGGPGSDTYQSCLDARLLSLRTDFGRDLSRLSSAERRTLDSVCSKVRVSGGREDYVQCISTQLEALRAKRTKAAPPPPDPPAPSTPEPASVAAVAPPAPPPPSGRPIAIWLGGGLVVALLGAAGLMLSRKSRPVARVCKTCGAAVEGGGDLCHNCRHEAAESLRRAKTERAEQERAEEQAKQDEQRRQAEQQEEQRRERARFEEEERLRREAEAQKEAENERQRIEQARRRTQASDPSSELDPYAILGVSNQASRAEIDAAFQQARAKYDVEQVLGLGGEMEEHYKAKTRDIERAYAMLTA